MNRILVIGVVIAIEMVFHGCAFQSDRLEQVDSYMDSLILADQFDGSLVVGNSQGILYQKVGGLALREWNIGVQSDTRFDIASLNKSFIGFIIMQLVDEGRIAVEDQLTKYLAFRSAFADSITIHHLLTHTSGLPDYDAIPDSLQENDFEAFKRSHFTSEAYVDFIGKLPPEGRPGKQFYYSNFAYHLLALLIEEVEGKHFSIVLQERIVQPLGLKDTYAPIDNYRIYDRLAGSYHLVGESYERTPYIDYSLGRRIFSSAKDLYKWGVEMVQPTLLSQASHEWLLTNHIGDLNPNVSYGYGWVVFDGKGEYRMGRINVNDNYIIHGGSTDGYRSILVVQEDGNWIVSMLTNNGGRVNELAFAQRIINLLTK